MSQDEVIKKIDQAGKVNLKRQHKQREREGGGERAERTVNRAFSICRI